MRLNRKGKPYQNPAQLITKCRIKNRDGLIYHPTKAPDGLCNCGVMLELKPCRQDYIFNSKSRAEHAISHTLKFLKENGIEILEKQFIIENA
jgi:hypothetical protein